MLCNGARSPNERAGRIRTRARGRAARSCGIACRMAAGSTARGDTGLRSSGAAKPTMADPFMLATGTEGFINPFTLNVATASDLFWFERPFDHAHEWSHVAAYAREDEANYSQSSPVCVPRIRP